MIKWNVESSGASMCFKFNEEKYGWGQSIWLNKIFERILRLAWCWQSVKLRRKSSSWAGV